MSYVDVDYCQFSDWGYKKPTRVWGEAHLQEIPDKVCDPKTCQNVELQPTGRWQHQERLGGNHMKFTRNQKYRVPAGLVRYVCGLPVEESLHAVVRYLTAMRLSAFPRVSFAEQVEDEVKIYPEDHLWGLAAEIKRMGQAPNFVRSVVVTENPLEGDKVEALRAKIFEDYGDSVFNHTKTGPPPVR